MVRKSNRLKALNIARVRKPGLYPDGGGLYLQVAAGGSKSWLFRFMLHGAARTMGLGSLNDVTLAEAREKVADARKLRAAGIDPIKARDAEISKAKLEAAKSITFKAAATQYIEAHRAGWKSAKHADQWTN
ncbi:MAG: Arm DNA-binding domain-containing protein, partial [Rhodospirillales bacterium]